MNSDGLIKTSFIYPPISVREFDWCAWYDCDGEEAGRYGWGKTEAEAIIDLRDNYECEES